MAPRPPAAALPTLACALFAGAAAAQTWTVDDDKPADFADLPAAIAAAAPGDVLLVQPGQYTAFLLDKELSILGPVGGERPSVAGLSRVQGATRFKLAALELDALEVIGVGGRGAIDDCRFGSSPSHLILLRVQDCGQLVVARSTVQSPGSVSFLFASSFGVHVENSTAAFVDTVIRGAKGKNCPDYDDGQGAVRAVNSELWFAGCDLIAGNGGADGFCISCGGAGGDALVATDSTVVLRGHGNQVDYGLGGTFAEPDGRHFVLQNSTVVYGPGLALSPPTLVVSDPGGTSTVIHAPVPEPFLTIGGEDLPGSARELMLHGPAGAQAVAVTSFSLGFYQLPAFEGAVWLGSGSLFQVVPLVTQGNGVPVGFSLPLPPSFTGLEGITLYVQAVFPGVPGTLDPSATMLTNPSFVTLRHEFVPDCNDNLVPDAIDIATGTSPDCDGNGVPDECDVAAGTSPDCNGNGVPDGCDLVAGTSPDCDGNGTPDECDVAAGTSPDCNGNGVPDGCDIAAGTSLDLNANGIPDECLADGDCNQNGIADQLDLLAGSSADCNANLVPDECETASQVVFTATGITPITWPVNHDMTLDPAPPALSDVTITLLASSDLEGENEELLVYMEGPFGGISYMGALFDAPGEGSHCPAVPDQDTLVIAADTWNFFVDGAGGFAHLRLTPRQSVNGSECTSSTADVTLAYVSSEDCNGNGVPDSCDVAAGTSLDANGDGVPDECQP